MGADCNKIFPHAGPISKGVILLGHGANLQPRRMDEMAEMLQQSGFTVYRPGFTGHCGDTDAYFKVTSEQWFSDARRFYTEAKKISESEKVPLFLVAYSFSAPVFLDLQNELPFQKRVLFAPALETKWWYPIMRFLAWNLPQSFTYASLNIPEYRANDRSGMASTIATDIHMDLWKREASKDSGPPTLVFIDPEDELVSYLGVQKFLEKKKWPNWRLEPVSIAEATHPVKVHHRIIDSASIGQKEWKRILAEMTEFFSK